MGFAEDVLHSYVARSLRRVFPEREGWEIKRKTKENQKTPDYFIQKKRFGRTRRILVDVAIVPVVTPGHVAQLHEYAEKMNRLLLPIENLVLVVPTDADISAIFGDIEILFLDVLRVEGKEIVWTKRFSPELHTQGTERENRDLED
jgi:hypothetical protein